MTKYIALLLAALLFPLLAHANETTTHDTLVIVIDGSGSMRDAISGDSNVRKITAAKSALKSVIDQIPQSTHVGVLLFVGDGWGRDSQLKWLSPIGPMNKDQLKAAINDISPDGGTPLGLSIKIAADELLKARSAQHNYGTYKLLVVTDGEANDGDLMQAYAPEVVRRGLQLDVIGVGMQGKHMLATMAHRYWGANDAIALNKALQTAIQVETANADAAQADYDLLKGLPDDVAKAWLGDVTNMDLANWPIGEQKPVPPPPASANTQADPQAAQPVQDSNQGKQKGCTAGTHGVNPVPTGLLSLLLIGLVALRRRTKLVRVRIK